MDDARGGETAAVLLSGGIDSAVLTAELCGQYAAVWPIFVRCGLYWEPVELGFVRRYLERLRELVPRGDAAPTGALPSEPVLRALTILELPVADVYGDHWAVSGVRVPGAETADGAVFLPGRNLFLIVKAAVWCALRGIGTLALGTLAANPFADSSGEFDEGIAALVRRSLSRPFRIERPFARISKTDVLRRGVGLPLELTFSCIRPVRASHCGVCNKCGERRRGFRDAAIPDPTDYAGPA